MNHIITRLSNRQLRRLLLIALDTGRDSLAACIRAEIAIRAALN